MHYDDSTSYRRHTGVNYSYRYNSVYTHGMYFELGEFSDVRRRKLEKERILHTIKFTDKKEISLFDKIYIRLIEREAFKSKEKLKRAEYDYKMTVIGYENTSDGGIDVILDYNEKQVIVYKMKGVLFDNKKVFKYVKEKDAFIIHFRMDEIDDFIFENVVVER